MRIGILGGGFSGLATAWFILHYTQGSVAIDLYDPEPIGGGASGIASGLLHPYVGRQARPSWQGEKCMRETHRLITEASHALAKSVILSKGILRPALTEQQVSDFTECAKNHPDTEWWEREKCLETVTGLQLPQNGGGLFLKEGLTLDVKSYLQGLWQACALHGTQFYQKRLVTDEDLRQYDRVLIAMGALCKNFLPLRNLPITAVKGQILELAWPEGIPPLPFSVNGQKHIVMRPDLKSCIVGSTYEHQFTSPHADLGLAAEQILPHIASFFPPLAKAEVLSGRAAFRASTPSHLPLAGKISDKFYFLTGLGSKGLLFHAWLGKRLARTLLTQNTKHLPPEIQIDPLSRP